METCSKHSCGYIQIATNTGSQDFVIEDSGGTWLETKIEYKKMDQASISLLEKAKMTKSAQGCHDLIQLGIRT